MRGGWWMALLVGWGLVAHAGPTRPAGDPASAEATTEPIVTAVPPVVLALPEVLATALREGDWKGAAAGLAALSTEGWTGPQRAEHALLRAWSLVRAGRASEAAPLVSAFLDVSQAPRPYRALTAAEALWATREGEAALALLEEIPAEHPLAPRALAVQAAILYDRGATEASTARWQALADRPDPSPGVATALKVLAERRGLGSPEALPFLRRLWRAYPTTEEGRWAWGMLGERYPKARFDWREAGQRATALMEDGAWNDAIEVTDPYIDQVVRGTADACAFAYARGRSLYKKNRLTDLLGFVGDAGSWCAGVVGEEGQGHKLLYLQGLSATRLKKHEDAAAYYARIAALYPDTSYADDGLTRAGVSWLEAGDRAKAQAAWTEALERFPTGDTVPEAAFRLAFTTWEDGQVDAAKTLAARIASLDPSADEVHVLAARYWGARWTAWPDVAFTDDPRGEARKQAVEAFAALASDAPHHLYGAMAFAHLAALSPTTAQGIAARPRSVPPLDRWPVRSLWIEDDAVREGIALMRVGLVREGLSRIADGPAQEPAETAFVAALQARSGDPVGAHGRMHDLLRARSAMTLGPVRDAVMALALPDLYGDLIRSVTADKPLPARMFHAIVREESRFDPDIRSFAGAVGLSQLMPATARDVAKRTGLPATDLRDPSQNLPIGAWYLDHLLERLEVPPLAMAAYNAGPGNVATWVKERGGVPLDVFLERIPFRETRGYAKRVSSTWQAYRYFRDVDEPAFLDVAPWMRVIGE